MHGLCSNGRRQIASRISLLACGLACAFNAWGVTPEVDLTSGVMSCMPASDTGMVKAGEYLYQAGFDSAKWSGSLKKSWVAFSQASSSLNMSATPEWDAGMILTGANGQIANPAPEARSIFTSRIEVDRSLTTIPFAWNQLNAEQQSALNTSPSEGKADDLGSKRLDYLRGERSLERSNPGGIFRVRDRVLGDIINSNPVHVGAPASNVQGSGYLEFYERYKRRPGVVYVGANDGLLHAFSAAEGKELFAYLPNALIGRLPHLTSHDYVHRPFADGPITVAEANVGAGSGAQWKTILVSGMGGGAQGIFALDVTDPSAFSSGAGALFEFTDSDDADIGNVIGAPLIAKFKVKSESGIEQLKYFVVVGSGVNNYSIDGPGKFNATGSGALFLLSLDKAASDKWQPGVNYFKFIAPITDPARQNGLISPTSVAGGDSATRVVYAGDLQGNLWRFDFSESAPWPNALGPAPVQPFFSARDSGDLPQAITVQPKVVFAPGGGQLVLFGTGKYLEAADAVAANYKTQSVYGIYDAGKGAQRISSRDQLALRTLQRVSVNGRDALKFSGNDFAFGTGGKGKLGWYFDFLDSDRSGERSVGNFTVAYGNLFFNSLIPGGSPCGGGRSYALDVLSGLPRDGEASGFAVTTVSLVAPVLVEGAASVSARNSIGRRTVIKKYSVLNSGSGDVKETSGPGLFSIRAGRFSWREVLNWTELRGVFARK
ncbi:hypothetical protein BH11PSE11_BH11PSE11_12770 [soil metagenome]